MRTWEIQRLKKSHDRAGFSCGQPSLDNWLKERAGQFDRKDLSRTFVASALGDQTVLGYYAIATHRVVFDAIPLAEAKALPRLDIPVVLLGRLAVDLSVQGQGLGSLLLVNALRRAA